MGEPFKPLNGGDSPLDMNERAKRDHVRRQAISRLFRYCFPRRNERAQTTCARQGHFELRQRGTTCGELRSLRSQLILKSRKRLSDVYFARRSRSFPQSDFRIIRPGLGSRAVGLGASLQNQGAQRCLPFKVILD